MRRMVLTVAAGILLACGAPAAFATFNCCPAQTSTRSTVVSCDENCNTQCTYVWTPTGHSCAWCGNVCESCTYPNTLTVMPSIEYGTCTINPSNGLCSCPGSGSLQNSGTTTTIQDCLASDDCG